jgi:hypothetical protein
VQDEEGIKACEACVAEALNPHRRRRPPSPNRSTPTLYYYKKGQLNLDHSHHHSTTSPFIKVLKIKKGFTVFS